MTPGTQETRMCEHATTTSPRTRSRVFPARPDQVREARKLISAALDGCPAADDAILCLSELAANAVLHSASGKDSGTFTVRAEIHADDYVWIEVEDNGGPWDKRAHSDGRPHGLDIVGELASAWGRDGDPLTGWVVWGRFDVPRAGPPHPASQDTVAAPASRPAPGAETTSQALTGLRAALAALGIATAGLTLTRYTGKLHPEHGPAVGYHAGLYWWPARRRHASRPVYAIHDARDPVGAARRIAPHHQPASPAEH
jgi:anti-sigma regulatory factor (Ser/Thr protein kinase)